MDISFPLSSVSSCIGSGSGSSNGTHPLVVPFSNCEGIYHNLDHVGHPKVESRDEKCCNVTRAI